VGVQKELFPLALTIAAGTVIPIQAGVNAALSRRLGHTVIAALVNFASGAVVLFVVAVVLRVRVPNPATLRAVPPWIWAGGTLGTVLVLTTTYVAPKLGATVMISFVLASQLVTSLVLDHYGLVGFSSHPLSPGRLLGVGLLLAGLVLVRRY
jgi:transporter family-2 protein